jgi:hypothetical protein
VREATAFPNVRQWFGALLNRLERLQTDDYIVLKWELDNASEEGQYRRDLGLLDSHIALAAEKCTAFSRLVKERSRPGRHIDSANRMILDKLAEIRAIAGLCEMGFVDIKHEGTPDLTVKKGPDTFAVEVTRLAAPSSQGPRPLVAVLPRGDASDNDLSVEIFNKVQAKQIQLVKSSPQLPHIVWVSLGRDYFTAGRYERSLTGLRRRMGRYASAQLALAAARVESELSYTQLSAMVLCLGRKESDLIAHMP